MLASTAKMPAVTIEAAGKRVRRSTREAHALFAAAIELREATYRIFSSLAASQRVAEKDLALLGKDYYIERALIPAWLPLAIVLAAGCTTRRLRVPGALLAAIVLAGFVYGLVRINTDAQYQPPPPYIPRSEDYEPFAIAAVELEAEQMVVLGQIADGYGVADLSVGQPVELVVEDLYSDDDHDYVVYKWRPVGAAS